MKLLKGRFSFWTMVCLILVGVSRIVLTYDDLSQTWDEPAHIAAGMEWLEKRQYQFEHQHPPLARVFGALGLYMNGAKLSGKEWMYDEGNELLYDSGNYDRNLVLARLGILPFFILGCVVMWSWGKRFSIQVGLLSLFFISILPPILAHAGVATTDMAAAATLVAAFFALFLWLKKPSLLKSILLGVATASCFLSKFSNIPFFLIGSLSALVLDIFEKRKDTHYSHFKLRVVRALTALLVCLIVIWGAYFFSIGSWNGYVVPAPEFFSGVHEVAKHNHEGHLAYLLGSTYMQGRLDFFPIAVGVKTPVPFLVLTIIGLVALARQALQDRTRSMTLMAPVCGLCVFVAGILSNLNLGIRHILAMYLLLSLAAGFGTMVLWKFAKRYRLGVVLVVILLLSEFISSWNAHPDYLAYYNFLGGKHPEEIVLDTSDWGQDARRLGIVLKQMGITDLSICYYGSANLDELGLPPRRKLEPYKRVSGWVAASLLCSKMGAWEPPYDQFSWLNQHKPVKMIGKSIRLYYIPEAKDTFLSKNDIEAEH